MSLPDENTCAPRSLVVKIAGGAPAQEGQRLLAGWSVALLALKAAVEAT